MLLGVKVVVKIGCLIKVEPWSSVSLGVFEMASLVDYPYR